ncbi:hypothetical protein EDC94DRAFT_662374 [Helicostylum pulchrum]|nr:hypothetical protein EDC94DRAFT_662374 [Helicostylum pulchrum]
MTSRNTLPTEILLNIFTYTSIRSLIYCQQVCKEWKYPARVVFYKDIQFLNSTQVERFNQSNKLDPSLGKLVRSIDFSSLLINSALEAMSKSLFTNVARSCPNVDRILVDYPSEDFWNLTYFLCLKYWSRLSYLPKTKRSYPEYLRTAMVCCQTLERLEVVPLYFENRGRHWTELANAMFKPFQKVHTLRFILYSYADIIYTFDSLLDQFIDITKLNLTYEGIYRRVQGDDHIVLDLTGIVPMRTLERLTMNKGHMNANTIRYLLKKFPNLQRIKMNLGYYHSEYTDSEIVSVFDYVMQMTNISIQLVTVRELDILRLFVARVGSSPISLSITYQGTHRFFGTFQSRIRLIHNKLYTAAGTNTYNTISNEPARIIIETDRNPSTYVDVYQKNLVEVIGSHLSFLYIDLQGGPLLESDFKYLDDVFQYCTLLKTLVYAARYLDQSTQMNASIRHLTLIGIKLSNVVFPQLSESLPSLQHFQLIDCEIVEEYIIDMSETSFQMFHLSDSSKEICCITIDILTGIDVHRFERERNKDYSITSIKQMGIILRCKSIKYIDVECDGLTIKGCI